MAAAPKGHGRPERTAANASSISTGENMLRHCVLGAVSFASLLAACTYDGVSDEPTANDPPSTEGAGIMATVVPRTADGRQVTTTETFTQSEFEAMVAARATGQAG